MVSMSKAQASEAIPVEVSSMHPGSSNSPPHENAKDDVYPEVQPLAEYVPGSSNTKTVVADAESKVIVASATEDKTVAKKAPAKPAAKPAAKQKG